MLKRYTSAFLLCCFFSLFISGCFAPQKIVRVNPDEQENVFWYQGQAIAEKKQDSIIVRAAFSHADREFLLFDIEVINERTEAILVTPEPLFLTSPAGFRIPAADPEAVILSMEMRNSRQEANAKNAAIASGVILVGAAVIAATSDSGSNSEGGDGGYDDYDAVDVVVDAVIPSIALGFNFHQDPILSVPVDALPSVNELYFWEVAALRRTTLRMGEHIRGLVAFPRFDDTNKLQLNIPIEQEDFLIIFKQRLYQP